MICRNPLHPVFERRAHAASWRARALVALAAGFVALAWAPSAARAQQAENVSLVASEQVFSVLAALNAAGYDTGLYADTGDTTRSELRQALAERNLAVLPQLKEFWAAHHKAGDPGAEVGPYISLALLLGPPPDFRPMARDQDLPPDARAVAGFVPLLRKFYDQSNLLALWSRFGPRYEAQIARYSDPVRRAITLTDAYLRFPSGAYLGRKFLIIVDLLGVPEQAQARIYGANYYLVLTPSRELKVTEIRHEYLHFLLDPQAVKYAADIKAKDSLRLTAQKAPALADDFKDDFSLLLTECLIRAVELRMDKTPKDQAEKAVQEMAASGLILAPYYYNALAGYEQQEAPMDVYYKDLLAGIVPAKIEKSLADVKFAAAPAEPEKQAQPTLPPLERLLNQADNSIYEKRFNDAKTAYLEVLEKFDPQNARALFGLGVVASNTRKPDTAEEYFKKTLAVAQDQRLVTWSHIYLGRIYDLKGDRKKALDQYRAASLTAASYPDALRAVQEGLKHPFGWVD